MKRFAILCLILLAACSAQEAPQDTQSGEGRVVFAVTDAAADMGAVSEVTVVVDSVKVRSAAKGWVDVETEQKSFNLLELKAESASELLADVQLEEGTYNELRLDISSVTVVDDEGSHEAKLPSGELKLKGDLVVEAEQTSTATFDFIADESLHVTGTGQYILAPVVQLETRSRADVDVKTNNRVEVRGGNVNANVKLGMGLDGNVGVGVQVPAAVELEVVSGLVKAKGATQSEGNASARASAKASSKTTVDAGNAQVDAQVDAEVAGELI